ncbi:MAG TPA: AAA family ATPase [Archangium sp.]|uniref:ParA family protein n=1 Tax=Archangium sp. TaxID=1872627 RepID=UPI002E356245|nr:AAA family ATPase [Archangium sp.]HEX5747185.1 AAA family ATPase [Archangium sp.]
MKSLVLFNNKGGVGKTTLTFNIAHMLARNGHRTVVLDYDPQCNLSAIFLGDVQLFEIWNEESKAMQAGKKSGRTVAGCIDLVRRGKGDVLEPTLVPVAPDLYLLPGHLNLSSFEQTLAEEWPKKSSRNNERALDVTTALDVLSNMAAERVSADIVLLDVGPSLGALNRAALLACDAVIVPLAPDLFSLQGLSNVGPTLVDWRHEWEDACRNHLKGRVQESLPIHRFSPIGYIVQQHLARADRMPSGYAQWALQIPNWFHRFVLEEEPPPSSLTVEQDAQCIAFIKHFASLVPLAQQVRKPLFDLKQADGIGGGQIQAVARCRQQFTKLVDLLLERLEEVPEATPFEEESLRDRRGHGGRPSHS